MYNIYDLAGKTIECTCGRKHEVAIKRIIVEAGAIDALPAVCQELGLSGRALLIADENTYKAAGNKVRDVLQNKGFDIELCMLKASRLTVQEMPHHAGFNAEAMTSSSGCNDGSRQAALDHRETAWPFEPEDAIATDERSIVRIMVALKPDTAFMLAVGSGTINDLVRFVSSRTGIPYICIPTAPSVDGYASTVVPLLMDGFKRTVPGTYPWAIIADTDVLCKAPASMIAAGFGDITGKLTALMDWTLARVLDGEYFCQASFDMMKTAVEQCLSDPEGIRQRKPKAIKALMDGLILSGVAMMLVGNSRPASGSEHHLAHYWEMMLGQSGGRQPYHGTKVGVATPIITLMYQKLLNMDTASVKALADKYQPLSAQKRLQHIADAFGLLADEVLAETGSAYPSEDEQRQRAQYIAQRWPDITAALRPLIPAPDDIRRRLAQAGAAYSICQLGISRDLLNRTLNNAMYIRTRYTILRLAQELGCLDSMAHTIAEEASRW